MMKLGIPHFIGLISLLSVVSCMSYKKVLLKDVQALTFTNGMYTTARRGSPIPQIKCIGGSAGNRFTPKSVQCYNRGSDGIDVQWECTADMPKKYKFGQISVSCEGFDYAADPYVLHGSCGLEYNLEYNSDYKGNNSDNMDVLPWIALIMFILFAIYIFMRGPVNDMADDAQFRRSGGPGYPPGGPPPPGFHPPPSAPPPYSHADPNVKNTQAGSGGSASFQPGFWTGAGLGALGGYMFGSRTNGGRRRHFARENNYDYYDEGPSTSGVHHRSSPSSSNSDTHTSSGFGGTTRR
uniref:Store-operated calcium entry-associated regulatory factor n=1 Tax=Steinernema glaseri TaxID=37863 RepID=A0A1I8AWQ9_9BILA